MRSFNRTCMTASVALKEKERVPIDGLIDKQKDHVFQQEEDIFLRSLLVCQPCPVWTNCLQVAVSAKLRQAKTGIHDGLVPLQVCFLLPSKLATLVFRQSKKPSALTHDLNNNKRGVDGVEVLVMPSSACLFLLVILTTVGLYSSIHLSLLFFYYCCTLLNHNKTTLQKCRNYSDQQQTWLKQ